MTGVQQAEAVVRQTWGQAASLGERKECRTGDRRRGRADSPMWKRGASARESADRAALSVWRGPACRAEIRRVKRKAERLPARRSREAVSAG